MEELNQQVGYLFASLFVAADGAAIRHVAKIEPTIFGVLGVALERTEQLAMVGARLAPGATSRVAPV